MQRHFAGPGLTYTGSDPLRPPRSEPERVAAQSSRYAELPEGSTRLRGLPMGIRHLCQGHLSNEWLKAPPASRAGRSIAGKRGVVGCGRLAAVDYLSQDLRRCRGDVPVAIDPRRIALQLHTHDHRFGKLPNEPQ